jgi:hypothetical protein
VKPSLKALVVSATIATLTLATAVPAFAFGPTGPLEGSADHGLMHAVTNINSNARFHGENPLWGSHNATCNAAGVKNPALGGTLKGLVALDCAAFPPERP